ncbi:MAG: ECF-type sigma factor [Acidobacteriota bacterium]|nr:ECF-type sigma factor [Acidobacteriota bacterium]
MADPSDVTQLLMEWNQGDQGALDRLMPLVYDTLHQIARARFADEREGNTLQPTALIGELYVRLTGDSHRNWKSRSHFFGAVSEIMRRILVDNARRRRAAKRGMDKMATPRELKDILAMDHLPDPDILLALDSALSDLKAMDPRQARIVELKYFVGLSIAEIAEMVEISERTVKHEWKTARAWLYRRLQ